MNNKSGVRALIFISVCFREPKLILNPIVITIFYEMYRPSPLKKICSTNRTASFEVEQVLDYRLVDSKLQFFIKWNGIDKIESTWEPIEYLTESVAFKKYIELKQTSFRQEMNQTAGMIHRNLQERIDKLIAKGKAAAMNNIMPCEQYELIVYLLFYHMLPVIDGTFQKRLEDLVVKNHFYQLNKIQSRRHDEFIYMIHMKEAIPVMIENKQDFDDPPEFEYIEKNSLSDDIYLVECNNGTGCTCKGCSNKSKCCPKLRKEMFPYKKNSAGEIVLKSACDDTKIIECGILCSCGIECINRESQKPKLTPLCLFKTQNRGWGLKAMTTVPYGKLIIEYTGEFMGQETACSREETAYLFDLNIDRRVDNNFYTIDSFLKGNLSRFFNHSCRPNAKARVIDTCHGDPKHQKLW